MNNPQSWADESIEHEKPRGMSTGAKVGCGCLILFILALAGCGAMFAAFMTMMKNTEPYRYAMEQARSSPALKAALGEPIEDGFAVSANLQLTNDDGTASYEIPVSGPEGSAVVTVEAVKTDGSWSYPTLQAHLGEGDLIIDLSGGEDESQAPE